MSCGANNLTPSPSPTALVEKGIESSFGQITSMPIATDTMGSTLAYWATAQQAVADAQDKQIAETKQAISLLSNQYPQMCGYSFEGVSVSPNRKWIATDCMWQMLRVFETNGNKIWDIPYSEIFEFYPEFLGTVEILHWSGDGKYLYFANRSCCADTDATTNGDTLYKLNLETGDWILLIPGVFNYYSFSPESTNLIYILNNQASANETLNLHLLNIFTGKEESINVGGFEQGWIIWKSDGQKISVVTQTGNIFEDNRIYSLVSVDLQTKQVQTIIPNTRSWLGIIDWSNDDILTITQTTATEYNGNYINVRNAMFYDLKTNLFITPTPTQ